FLAAAMDTDLEHGVRHTLRNVVASSDVRIWETDLSVSDETYCCAPAVVWLQRLDKGRVRELHLLHRRSDP
ncbi:MAG TPA: sigma-70 family RNA polymerase sigma factor, partial [Rugosimonospora sp.]